MHRRSVESPHSESNVVATLHSIGKINKGIREYSNPTPVKLYIQVGRSTKVLGNTLRSRHRLTLHSLKILNKGLFLPPSLNFYIH